MQDFSAGSGATGDQKNFLLLTELTSLVSQAKKDDLIKKLQTALPGSQVDVAKEGEDRFFVVLKDKASINETYGKIGEVFKGAGYPKYSISSDVWSLFLNCFLNSLSNSNELINFLMSMDWSNLINSLDFCLLLVLNKRILSSLF